MITADLNPELKEGLKEIAARLDFRALSNVRVTAERGKEFTVSRTDESLHIIYTEKHEFFYGITSAAGKEENFTLRRKSFAKRLGALIDCSRNAVPKLSSLKTVIAFLAAAGYDNLQLYTEDTYEIEGQPYFGYMRGRYSRGELKEIDAFAASLGIELVPCIQTLAHLDGISRWPEYSDIIDIGDVLLAGNDRTYEFIDLMFAAVSECFTGRRINIGMDEAHLLGLGKYLERNGFRDRSAIMAEHLRRVCDIAQKHGFECMMWSDMFFKFGEYGNSSEILKPVIPENATPIYWDYYGESENHYLCELQKHDALKRPAAFAGGVWTWTGFTPHNRISLQRTRQALAACRKKGVNEIIMTAWGDDGGECPVFAALPALFHAAAVCYGVNDAETKRQFENLAGISFSDYCALDSADLLPECENKLVNPDKYMLFNDLFCGLFDSTVRGGEGEIYARHARKLKSINAKIRFFLDCSKFRLRFARCSA